MKRLNKKGQLEGLTAAAVAIATLSIMLVVAFLILGQGKTQTITQPVSTTAVGNESHINSTASVLSDTCMDITGVTVKNTSKTGATISSAAYTIVTDGFTSTFTPVSNPMSAGNNGTVYVDYTCVEPTAAYNSTLTLTAANSEIAPWVPLIIIVLAGVAVMGVLRLFRS